MAAPRVFLSSTYYDLKHVRSEIADFITGLGYKIVMNERDDIPYSQTKDLEYDCYGEILTCDIVVCIIGNSFGTQSADDDHSITMHELEQAIEQKKLIYVFIEKNVFIENRTYIKNSQLQGFQPDAVSDIRIHEFIKDLKDKVGRSRYIQSFETVHDIIDALRNQFAGIFQSLLASSRARSESKQSADLQEEINRLKDVVDEITESKIDFDYRLKGTMLFNNPTVSYIERLLGINKFKLHVTDIWGLDQVMGMMEYGFTLDWDSKVANEREPKVGIDTRLYTKTADGKSFCLTVDKKVFADDGAIIAIRDLKKLAELIQYNEEDVLAAYDDSMPF